MVLFFHDVCVVVAQACHWFNWTKIWPELARVLKKNGSAAFWVCILISETIICSVTLNILLNLEFLQISLHSLSDTHTAN